MTKPDLVKNTAIGHFKENRTAEEIFIYFLSPNKYKNDLFSGLQQQLGSFACFQPPQREK